MKLTALQPDNPIAWMAACGALRLLPGARLRWEARTPELEYDGDILATLASLPAERLKSPEIQFGTKLGAKMHDAAWQDLKRLPEEWALALGAQSEAGMGSTKLKMRPGDYDMLHDTRTLLERLTRCDISEKLTEALQGPWRYEDTKCVAWGWDAAARIDAAAIGSKVDTAPTFGVLGAYWLGWEALPLFPTIAGETRGWSDGLRYPTWSQWLDYPQLKALILGLDRLRTAELKALGVRIWFARYLKTHVSSGRLSWAGEVARTPSSMENPRGSRGVQAPGFMIV
jgi:hypothetical protein